MQLLIFWFLLTSLAKNISAINDKELLYLKERITFARATYCLEGLSNWTCVTCDQLSNTRNISFAGDFSSTVFGYVAYAKAWNTIVVAFRGTRTFNGWIKDMRFAKPDCPFPNAPDDAAVHLGFLEAWMFLKPQIVESLFKLMAVYPSAHLLITGHSLGGAVSTLCLTDLYNSYNNLTFSSWTVITVGQPRVGNSAFVQWTESIPAEFYRIVNNNDIVPHLPPKFVGFEHMPTEVWIHGNQTLVCPDNDDRTENAECANSYHLYSIPSHKRIWEDELIGIPACFPGIPSLIDYIDI